MSMQRIYNYGSSLQAFALMSLIKDLDASAEISFLDYRPGPTLVGPSTTTPSSHGRFGRTLSKLREYNEVDARLVDKLKFFNHKRSYAQKYFPLVGIAEAPSASTNVDLQVIGSDEVFNCVQDNVNVGYSRDLFGHDTSARCLTSYAASFGNTTLEKIESAGIRAELTADLRGFDAISVRDKNSADIVENLTGTRPLVHLDPTLVYDFAASRIPVPQGKLHHRDYVVVYGYSGRFNDIENAAIRRYAQEIDADVLAFGGLQGSADAFVDCDPFTLLAYFRDARAVITDTFHGSIFSIINRVPFATIVRPSTGHSYGNQEKLGYLLEVLQLSDRAWHPSEDLSVLLGRNPSYEQLGQIIETESARSRQYLSGALDLAKQS